MDITLILSKYRSWTLAIFLSIVGLAIYFILEPIGGRLNGSFNYLKDYPEARDSNNIAIHSAAALFFWFGGLAWAFVAEPLRWKWSVIFAIISGLVIGGISYVAIAVRSFTLFDEIVFWSGVLAVAIAVPLFQNIRDNGRWSFEYDRLHFHAWANTVILFSALVFTLLSWLLFFAIAQLFDVIGILFLDYILDKAWFYLPYLGASFGAALGILRDNEKIIGTLQNIVLITLSILGLPFAFGLVCFLLALLVNGFNTLWNATDSASALLIICAVWAVILSNAIIRNNAEEASSSKLLQYSALTLGCTVLPLAAIAAISAGLRIQQYGLSPARMWGFIIILVACAYGAVYLFNIMRYRQDWAQYVRRANIKLAIALCTGALFLALPIANFGAISAWNQLSRYDDGMTNDEDFDYAALAFDFGPKARELLREKAKTASPLFNKNANIALTAKSEYDLREKKSPNLAKQKKAKSNMSMLDGSIPPELLIKAIAKGNLCQKVTCAGYKASDTKIIVVESFNGDTDRSRDTDGYRVTDGYIDTGRICTFDLKDIKEGIKENIKWYKDCYISYGHKVVFDDISQIKVRDVTRKQIFIKDKPVGNVLKGE